MKRIYIGCIFILTLLVFFMSCRKLNVNYIKTNYKNIFKINYSYENYLSSGKDISIAFSEFPDSFNPYMAHSEVELFLKNALYATLFSIDPKTGLPEENLAYSYEINNDGKEYVFLLKDNLKFSNGKTLDSKDVIASLSLLKAELKDSGIYNNFFINNKTLDVENENENKIKIKLDSPNSNIIFALSYFPVIPKEAVEDIKSKNSNFINYWNDIDNVIKCSSGPFSIKSYNESAIELNKNVNYFKLNKEGKNFPETNKIILKLYPNKNKEVLGFVNNNIDVMSIKKEDFKNLYSFYKNKDDTKIVYSNDNLGKLFMAINGNKENSKSYLKDADFRKYISINIAKEIINNIKNNFNYSTIVPDKFLNVKFNKDKLFGGKDRDGKLFYKDKSKILITVIAPGESEELVNLAKLTGKVLTRMNLGNKINILSYSDYAEKLYYKHEYDIVFFYYSIDPGIASIYSLLKKHEIGFNQFFIDQNLSDGIYSLLDDCLKENNLKIQKEMVQKFDELFCNSYQLMPIYAEKNFFLIKNNIYNFKINSSYDDCFNLKTIENIVKY